MFAPKHPVTRHAGMARRSLFPQALYSGRKVLYVRPGIRAIATSLHRGAPAEWIVPEPLGEDRARFHDDPLLDAILSRRLSDHDAAADFLDERPRAAPDPHALPGLSEAAERIAWALRRDEPIGIFGDYDTDGVTSAALLTLALRAASGGAQPAAVRLPRRPEGYGLSETGVEELSARGVRLLVAVDCGSKDHGAVARARELGMEVVILDHHRIVETPPSEAVVA
jgi:single-stranded-DNA-specific exonuclease